MSELPVSQRYYTQSVLISEFIAVIKKIKQENEKITDVHFSPVVKGYDICLKKGESEIRVTVKCRKIFDGCVAESYESGRRITKSVIRTKDDVYSYIQNLIK